MPKTIGNDYKGFVFLVSCSALNQIERLHVELEFSRIQTTAIWDVEHGEDQTGTQITITELANGTPLLNIN